jgi:hypothetical protein
VRCSEAVIIGMYTLDRIVRYCVASVKAEWVKARSTLRLKNKPSLNVTGEMSCEGGLGTSPFSVIVLAEGHAQ